MTTIERRVIVFLLLLSFSLALLPQPVGSQQASDVARGLADFKLFYEKSLPEHATVGSSFMFIRDGQVVSKDFYGLANIELNRPVDEETIYHWASVTKMFTGIAIMQLRDRGLLKLDDPIIKYLPDLKGVHNPFGDMGDITIRHLMTHSSGFRRPSWPWKDREKQPWQPHEPQRWEQLVAMIPYTEILFKPGSKYSYSNLGVVFLGRVIELLTTDDYEVYMDKNIFKPLEMYRSYFDATPYHLMKYRARSYFFRDGRVVPGDPDVNTGITVANGGLNAPLGDMVKYASFLIGGGPKQPVYEHVLKRSTLEEMFAPRVEVSTDRKNKVSMGLLFFVEDHYGRRYVGHSGEQVAFLSRVYVNLDSRTGYITAFNTIAKDGQKDTKSLSSKIADYLYANVFPLYDKLGPVQQANPSQ